MGDELTLTRFETLAMAYGGDLARWPNAERALAEAVIAAHPRETGRLLEAARSLDTILSAAPAEAPSSTLLRSIIRDATTAPAPARFWRWLMGLGLGAGLAGAAAAGVAAGLVIAPMAVAPRPPAASADPIAQASTLLSDAPDLADG
ncbi:MAG TPA: hypothetical protein VII73_13240 [Caulobacteraceae bacterium]